MSRAAFVASCVLLVACSGNGAGPIDANGSQTSATGTVRSAPVRVTSAYANRRADFGFGVGGVELYVDTGADTCSARFPATKNATNFVIDVVGEPLGAGDYAIIDAGPGAGLYTPKQGEADVVFNTTDATCAEGTEDVATGGKLTLTASDATHVAGTFDITFSDGHVTGTFDAPICDPKIVPTYSVVCN